MLQPPRTHVRTRPHARPCVSTLALGVAVAVASPAMARTPDRALDLPFDSMSLLSPLLVSPPAQPPEASAAPTTTAAASGSPGEIETGTDPSKLLLRVEMNPQFIELPGDGSLFVTNFKLDVPITKSIGVAIDAPVSYASGFPAPIEDQFGFGDVAVRARHVWSFERSSLIAGAEAVLRTADDELLGSGKWQLNPSVAFVYYLSSEYLLATAWKQRLSFAGDDGRADLNVSEFRVIGIYINPKGWWLQADYQPKVNWDDGGAVSHLIEFEAGAMISRSVGLSIRPGFGFGANRDRDWSLGVGVRFLF